MREPTGTPGSVGASRGVPNRPLGSVRLSSWRRPALSCSSSATRPSRSRRARRRSLRRILRLLDAPKAVKRNRAQRKPSPAAISSNSPSVNLVIVQRLKRVTVPLPELASAASPTTEPTMMARSRKSAAIVASAYSVPILSFGVAVLIPERLCLLATSSVAAPPDGQPNRASRQRGPDGHRLPGFRTNRDSGRTGIPAGAGTGGANGETSCVLGVGSYRKRGDRLPIARQSPSCQSDHRHPDPQGESDLRQGAKAATDGDQRITRPNQQQIAPFPKAGWQGNAQVRVAVGPVGARQEADGDPTRRLRATTDCGHQPGPATADHGGAGCGEPAAEFLSELDEMRLRL